MAHKKAAGSSRNGRDSQGQRRGVKKFGGELVKAGNILVRQVGSTFHAGTNVGTGKDYTLFSKVPGHGFCFSLKYGCKAPFSFWYKAYRYSPFRQLFGHD